MKTQRIAGPQLSIFRAHTFDKPPERWTSQKYEGPKEGDLCHVGFKIALSLPGNTMGAILNTYGYAVKINYATREVLIHCPFLKDAPWCKDHWYITDLYLCEPYMNSFCTEQEFSVKNPIKDYPGEIPWDLFNIKRESRK